MLGGLYGYQFLRFVFTWNQLYIEYKYLTVHMVPGILINNLFNKHLTSTNYVPGTEFENTN